MTDASFFANRACSALFVAICSIGCTGSGSSSEDLCGSIAGDERGLSIKNCQSQTVELFKTYNNLGQVTQYDFVAFCESNGKLANGSWSSAGLTCMNGYGTAGSVTCGGNVEGTWTLTGTLYPPLPVPATVNKCWNLTLQGTPANLGVTTWIDHRSSGRRGARLTFSPLVPATGEGRYVWAQGRARTRQADLFCGVFAVGRCASELRKPDVGARHSTDF